MPAPPWPAGWAAPAGARSFMAPAPEQMSSMVRGWTSGAASAAPMLNSRHAAIQRRNQAIDLRVFMLDKYREAKYRLLDMSHVA